MIKLNIVKIINLMKWRRRDPNFHRVNMCLILQSLMVLQHIVVNFLQKKEWIVYLLPKKLIHMSQIPILSKERLRIRINSLLIK